MNVSIPNTKCSPSDYEAKMVEAQSLFRRVVKAELQLLLDQNIARDMAVKKLLQRIVKSATEPSESEVRKVMYQFQMNRDDAVRALIVKQELARLKQRGLNSFAAITELTLKMQLLLPLSPMSNRDSDDEAGEPDPLVLTAVEATTTTLPTTAQIESAHSEEPNSVANSLVHAKRKRKASTLSSSTSPGAAGAATLSIAESPGISKSSSVSPPLSPTAAEVDDSNAALSREVSLCQRIGNWSISASAASPKSGDTSSTLISKSTRKRRKIDIENSGGSGDKAGNSRVFGTKKKLLLDVDQKFKAQFHGNIVKLGKSNNPPKSNKRAWAKCSDSSSTNCITNGSDAVVESPSHYNPKKHRSD
ncbi:hypothetical protein DYB32_009179 [Aphanomyces invadans]|uniref:Uncharacterized protein n=1 Tax=Aphanomyces invadans TaxID=157072 RepID=A0A418APW3_9STRA|nr:hypothetical protein DYB32_009179 [Aphanomyces invadans]